jgi:hypothetical protein
MRASFAEFGVTENIEAEPPTQLRPLADDFGFQIATDPREVSAEWLDESIRDAPVAIVGLDLSHNTSHSRTSRQSLAWA